MNKLKAYWLRFWHCAFYTCKELGVDHRMFTQWHFKNPYSSTVSHIGCSCGKVYYDKDMDIESPWKKNTNPPSKSGLVLVRVGTTQDPYIAHYRGDRGYEVWGLGRKEPVTDIKVIAWMNIPSLGKCPHCKVNEARMSTSDREFKPICGPCFEKMEYND